MNSPHLDPGDWLAVTTTGLLAGIGGAMAWFAGNKKEMELRMTKCEATHATTTTSLAVMENNHKNLSDRMDEVRELGLSAHRKLDEVLMEVRRH